KAASLAGWLHDLGKYTEAFQAYIDQRGSSVDHSTAGAREVLKLAAERPDKLMADLLAYGIAGHHSGLPDRTGETGALEDRLKNKTLPALDLVWRSEVAHDAGGLFPSGFKAQATRERQAFQLA